MAYTLDDIAYRTGFNKSSISRRLKSIRPAYQQSNGGRPVNYYDSSVLSLFPALGMQLPEVNVLPTVERVVEMKKTNPCKNKSRVLSEKLNDMLIKETYSMFMAQGDHNGLKRVCEDLIANYWIEIENDLTESGKIKNSKGETRDCEYFQQYWYFKVINRQDKVNAGVAVRENWKLRWAEKHNFNKANGRKATARYSMLEVMEKEGLIAPGRGAGAIWVIDGTQFDAWTNDNGKPKTFNYLLIMDGVTKLPLHIKALENGEKISEVAEALWECVQQHGVPPLGIVADNGNAFKSREIQAMVRAWYTPEQLAHFRKGCPIRRELFRDKNDKPQRGAILYPLKNIPRAPFKATIERSFKELNRHQQKMLAVSYSGTRDSMYLTHELGTTPTTALKHALGKEESFMSFLYYVYFDYAIRQQPGSEHLKWLKTKHNISPTPANAWKFYGGKWKIEESSPLPPSKGEIGTAIEVLSLEGESRLALNESTAIPFYEFAKAEKRHKVCCGDNYVKVTHNKVDHMYVSDRLNAQTWGKEVTVVVGSYNPRIGYVFFEKEMSEAEKKLAKAEGVIIDQSEAIELWCVGESTMINEFAQVREVRQRTSDARKAFKQEIEDYDMEHMGKKFEYRNQAVDNLKQLQFADCQVLDANKEVIPLNPPSKGDNRAQPASPSAGQLLSSENLPKGKETFGRYEEADIANLLDITDLMSGI